MPIGVPALKTLSDEMAAKDPLIKMTYENAKNGDVMPNIPQMGKFWSSMATAFQIATNGQAPPKAALDDAKKKHGKVSVDRRLPDPANPGSAGSFTGALPEF